MSGDGHRLAGRTPRWFLGLLGVALLAGMWTLRPAERPEPPYERITAVARTPVTGMCTFTEPGLDDCARWRVLLTSGPLAGNLVTVDQPGAPGPDPFRIATGDRLILGRFPSAPTHLAYFVVGRDARMPLLALAFLLVAVVLVAAGRKGVRTVAALALASALLLGLLIPALLAGRHPLAVAAAGGFVILAAAVLVTHGRHVGSMAALAGAGCGLGVTVALGALTVAVWDLPVTGGEHAWLIGAIPAIGSGWLVVAGAVVSVLGAADDLCVTQAAVVAELRSADAALRPAELFRRSMRVGREHVAAGVNTLLLATVGASLPALLAGGGAGALVSDAGLSGALAGALVGVVGVVAAVPATTWLAVRWTRPAYQETTSPPTIA